MLSEFQKKKIARMFQFYDADGSGSIQANDFDLIAKNFAQEFGWKIASAEEKKFNNSFKQFWRRLLISADQNRDEAISLEEFYESYNLALSSQESYETLVLGFLDNIFPIVDVSQQNGWSKDAFLKFYKGFRNSTEQAQKVFAKMDINNDGILSKEELYQHFYDFHFSQDTNAPGNLFFGEL